MNLLALGFLIATLFGYILNKKLYRKYPYLLFSPAILLPVLLMLAISALQSSYSTYMHYNQWIVWLLGPATVAFAIPIYEYRDVIRQHVLSIGLGIILGMTAGVVSAFYLANLFDFDQITRYSLMSRSISTPFAMELTQDLGGSVELVILFTMMTGILGVACADLVLIALRLNSRFAQGAALGNAAHGFGTSKAFLRHRDEGVIACLSMVLSGIFMVLFGPLLVHGIISLLS
ncbi:LrgB family protein [Acinetobacter sp. CAAS 2-6]|uniref:LrgB family protein n=1 Tax=Acinetobacter sp. CAAS 2-6 TaxID=3016358 RepID=UPI002DD6AFD4|nr:LrgB family protein [Acinetobacter sp. CAAS 2-6]